MFSNVVDECQCNVLGFPIVFTAIKCGTSGHNVRVAPSLDSTAIGMVVVGNQLTATREVSCFFLQ